MKLTQSIMAGLLAGAMLSSAALAQTTTPAPATGTAPAAMSAASSGMDKSAMSKACSDEANQKGLRGKARKTFRSKCKKEKMGK